VNPIEACKLDVDEWYYIWYYNIERREVMAGVEKIIEKMIHRPNGVRFREISKVLEHHGYIEVRVSGSHHHFRNREGDLITIPIHNPIKAVYVKDVLRRIGR
jgi:predicted RNA binding protein YcfA (HicA-like mRNA interferase family)